MSGEWCGLMAQLMYSFPLQLEEEKKRLTAGVWPSKTMEVVLSSTGQGRKREVVMVRDVVTGRQTIRMRIADGRSKKEKQVSVSLTRTVLIN